MTRFAFIASMTDIIDANKKNKFTHAVCKESIFNVNVVMYFPRDFYLVESINRKISSFLSSGVMSHLIGKYVDLRYWNVKSVEKGPQKLTIEHLRGAFNLWMIFSAISILTFAVEIFVKKIGKF
jgi:hypothetical protein